MEEEWRDIPEFPGYAVSNHGRILHDQFARIMTLMVNQQGIVNVGMMKDGTQYKRAVAPLVARAFLPVPPRDTFDTPIHLNGDRTDLRVENLAWRPRWFAILYHAQLNEPTPWNFKGTVELIETGEKFKDLRECSTKYGLLEKEIIMSATSHRVPVFPTWQTFQLVL